LCFRGHGGYDLAAEIASLGAFTDLKPLSNGQLNGVPWSEAYAPGALEAITYNDQIVAALYDFDVYALYYRADLFDQKGVQPPKTWDDLLAAGDKLKTAGFLPITAGLKDGCRQPEGCWDALVAKLDEKGCKIITGRFGGEQLERATGIAVDPSGGVCITGSTFSARLGPPNALNRALHGIADAFLARLTG
jgi:ABC-type glycerol-3-phosphate transport system substrate-binding protein